MITLTIDDLKDPIDAVVRTGNYQEKILHEDENELIDHKFTVSIYFDNKTEEITLHIDWITEPVDRDVIEKLIFENLIDSLLKEGAY